MNWYSSDYHIFHKNIIEFSHRPFNDVYEMREAFINNINDLVGKKDKLICLGDVAFGMGKKWQLRNAKEFREAINCEDISLVFGNHDHLRDNEEFKSLFTSTHDILELTDPILNKIVACHYPFASWRGSNHGRIHLHGHCHGNLKQIIPTRIDVGVDCHNYKPICSEQILEIVNKRKQEALENKDWI